jgi:hypothetical protein
MFVSEIQSRVQNIFGDTAGAQLTPEMILDWINDGQTDICRKAECLEDIWTGTTVAADSSLARPTNFIRELWIRLEGITLRRQTAQSINVLYPEAESNTTTGKPLYYYHFSNAINFYPVPDSAYGISMAYIRNAVKLTGSSQTPEIPEIYHEDLVQYCLWRALQQDEQWGAAQQARQDYDTRLLQTIYDAKTVDAETYPSVRSIAGDTW